MRNCIKPLLLATALVMIILLNMMFTGNKKPASEPAQPIYIDTNMAIDIDDDNEN